MMEADGGFLPFLEGLQIRLARLVLDVGGFGGR